MFIKLTRKDNSPIWICAERIVTIEPGVKGGSVVVPLGDGLDYDVQENPETVLAMIAGEPVAVATAKKEEVATPETPAEEVEVAKPKRATRKTKTKADVVATKKDEVAKPKRASRKTKAKAETVAIKEVAIKEVAKEKEVATDDVFAKSVPEKKVAKKELKEPVFFPEEYIDRLRRMMPGNIKKLANTLEKQFKVSDSEPVIRLLKEKKVINLTETNRVIWNSETEK